MRQILTTIIIQVIFYVFIFYRNMILEESPVMNGILYGLLILGLSYFIFHSFYAKAHRIKTYLLNLFTLFVLLELMNYYSYKQGMLPKYHDVPTFWSFSIALIAIAIYLGILAFLAYLIRKLKKVK